MLAALVWGLSYAQDLDAPPALRICADHITLDPERSFAQGQVTLSYGPWAAAAEALSWSSVGLISLEQARLDPCGCGGSSPWSIGAQRATLNLDHETLALEAPRLYLGSRAVLGWPGFTMRLDRSGPSLGLPSVGVGADGLQLGLPLRWSPQPQLSLGLTPEWRMQRGLRALGSVRSQGPLRTELQGSLGYDYKVQAWRGAVAGQLSAQAGGVTLALGGDRVSDAAWFADYGGDLPSRGALWTTTRGELRQGPLALELRAWQLGLGEEALQAAALPSLVLRSPVLRHEGLSLAAGGRVDLISGQPRLEGATQLHMVESLGPVQLRGQALARAWAYEAGPRASALLLEQGLSLPAYRVTAHGVQTLSLGLAGGLSVAQGQWSGSSPLSALDPGGQTWSGLGLVAVPGLDAAPGPLWLTPSLALRQQGRGRVGATVRLPLTPSGPALGADLDAARGPLSARLSWVSTPWEGQTPPPQLGSAAFRWRGDSLDLSLNLWHRGPEDPVDQALARASLDLRGSRGLWTPSAAALLVPEGWQSLALGLDWSATCGCVALGAMGSVAQDQPGLRLGLNLSLHPAAMAAPPRADTLPREGLEPLSEGP